MDLTLNQTRLIGCLIEKAITTPEQYPLSLNALTLACNQKSNREPVMALSENAVQDLIEQLAKKRLISEESGFGSRVVKYKHRFCNSEFGELKLNPQELGIITVMLLRGPQTPGELRSRTNRLCRFSDVHEVEKVLQLLTERSDGPFVAQLPREPGKRESRYCHLFSGEVEAAIAPSAVSANTHHNLAPTVIAAEDDATQMGTPAETDRLQILEREVTDLRQQLAAIKAQLDELLS
ncbi:MAG: DUF480 domain-containing protein [Motiliproteus sp.]